MFDVKITIDLSPTTLEAITGLTEALKGQEKKPAPRKRKSAPALEKEVVTPTQETPAEPSSTTPAPAKKEQQVGEITKEDIKRNAILAVQKNQPAVAKMLKDNFPGVARVTEVPEADYPRVIELLNSIING